jgi:serine/threonine-protein kinase
MEPKTFGHYRVSGELGRDAAGSVYRALDSRTGREVAIRTLSPDLPEEAREAGRARFAREARAAGRIRHPHVAAVFDVGEQDGIVWLAMEILHGRSLRSILRQEPRLSFECIADLVAQVAEALDHAADAGVVHRNVKPANIWVDLQGRAKLADFGLAYLPQEDRPQPGGTVVGSPRYLSPEQVLGLAPDPRADIFSLGVVLYEMLAGRTPFERPGETDVYALLNRIAGEPHPPVRSLDPAIPEAFEGILDRALAKNPHARYARAGEMAADLRRLATPQARPAAEAAATTVPAPAPQAAHPGAPSSGPNGAPRRSSALDILRRKAAERPASEHPARRKAAQDDALDRTLRGGFRYLASFAKELNEVLPAAGLRYDYLYLGALPPVTLSDAFVDLRPRRMEGRDFCDHIVFRFRITLSAPARATVLGADIERLERMLKAVRVPFEMTLEAKDDFGRPKRASFTVRGTLPCEAALRGDYDRGCVVAELVNVRRPGTQVCTLGMAQFESAVDEFARYVLGADDDFARHFPR